MNSKKFIEFYSAVGLIIFLPVFGLVSFMFLYSIKYTDSYDNCTQECGSERVSDPIYHDGERVSDGVFACKVPLTNKIFYFDTSVVY